MKKISIIIVLFSVILCSCDVLLKTASTVIETEKPLTTADVSRGLKEALRVGVDTAVVKLSKTNGYFLDPVIKINLPPETQTIVEYAKKVPGIDKMIDDVILQINRSAEDAALKAAPVFKNAILSMSIEDAWTILNGADNAATNYLKEKTYSDLMKLYEPIMQESLNKPLVAGVSANDSWNAVTDKWNKFATSIAGKVLNVEPVKQELDTYVTDKAIQGVFVKVADQELKIRNNADARVNEILKRVFAGR